VRAKSESLNQLERNSKKQKKKMSHYEQAKMPMFDGNEEKYFSWEIQWKAFAQVENLVSVIVKELDTYMPASIVVYYKTEKTGTTRKEQKVAVKANRQAMAYLT